MVLTLVALSPMCFFCHLARQFPAPCQGVAQPLWLAHFGTSLQQSLDSTKKTEQELS